MKKQQWQTLYDALDEQHSKFLSAYATAQSGRNKQIRERAAKEADYAIAAAERHLDKYHEAWELVFDKAGPTDYGRAIVYDEFKQPRYFGGDMSDLLRKIKEVINALPEVE